MPLDLNKNVQTVRKEAGLNLIKKMEGQGLNRKHGKSQNKAIFDVSGSMRGWYLNGTVTALATRVLGLTLLLDDDGKVPVYLMDDGVIRVKEPLTAANVETYVKDHVIKHVGGSTDYGPTFEAVEQDLALGDPQFIHWFTDGETSNANRCLRLLKRLSFNPVFFQFYAIGNASFGTLKTMNDMPTMIGDPSIPSDARFIDNAGISFIDLETITDEQMYDSMLNEFPKFIKNANDYGLLPWASIPQINENNAKQLIQKVWSSRPELKPQGKKTGIASWFR